MSEETIENVCCDTCGNKIHLIDISNQCNCCGELHCDACIDKHVEECKDCE